MASTLFNLFSGIALVLMVGILDHISPPEISFSLFYLAPVLWVTWFCGRRWGLVTSTLSIVTWLVTDALAGVAYPYLFALLWTVGTRLATYIAVLLFVDILKGKLHQAEEVSVRDSLTNVLNMRGFNLLAESEVAKAQRDGTALTIAYIDADNFKMLNDRRGHREGDKALKLMASVMTGILRQSDAVARLGGDEFVVLLPQTDKVVARNVISRLRQALLNAMCERSYPVTFSIGIATFYNPPASVSIMCETADSLMYQVKHNRKDGMLHEVYDGTTMGPISASVVETVRNPLVGLT